MLYVPLVLAPPQALPLDLESEEGTFLLDPMNEIHVSPGAVLRCSGPSGLAVLVLVVVVVHMWWICYVLALVAMMVAHIQVNHKEQGSYEG